MKKLIIVLTSFLSIAFVSCDDNHKKKNEFKNEKSDSEELGILDKEYIRKVITDKYKIFKKSMQEDNADFFRDLYTKDAIFYKPDTSLIGNDAIRDDFEVAIQSGIVINCTPIELEFYESTVFELGKAIIQNKDGKILANERYIVIWKKEGNTWKIHRDIPIKTK